MMHRALVLAFGAVAYLAFLGSFVYAVGFTGDLVVPFSVDAGRSADVGTALLINLGLLSLFALQHSGMARSAFKRATAAFVPKPMERSVYVLAASLTLLFMFWQWRPAPLVIWDIPIDALRVGMWILFWLGWLLVLVMCFVLDHGHLFGMGHVWAYWRGREYVEPPFRLTLAYRYVRNPQMLGFLVAFWAAPTMTLGRLLLAVIATIYVCTAIRFEERDLLRKLGESYAQYRRQTSMLIPLPWRRVRAAESNK